MRPQQLGAALLFVAVTTAACFGPGRASSSSTTRGSATTDTMAQPAISVIPGSGGPGTTVHVAITNCPIPDNTEYGFDIHFMDSAYIANKNYQAGFHSFPRQENGSTAAGDFQVTPDLPKGPGRFVAFCGRAATIVGMPFVVQ